MKRIYRTEVFTSNTALSYYLLGAYCTDGCLSATKQINLSSLDKDWLESIRDSIVPHIKIGKYKTSNCYRIAFTNSIIYEWLVANGCTPRKSLIIKYPIIPKEYTRDFIRGCLDGDGSISTYTASKKKNGKTYYNKKAQAYICSASVEFIDGLKAFLDSIGIIGCKSVGKPKRNILKRTGRFIESKTPVYRLYFGYRKCKQLLQYLYYPDCFSMPRKQNIALAILNG